MKWMHPGDAEVIHAEIAPHPDGRFRLILQEPDGEKHDVSGRYLEVVADAKLVFTWAWRTTPERESLVTIALRPDGDGTWLTLTHEQLADEAARDAHRGGWTEGLDGLEHYFA